MFLEYKMHFIYIFGITVKILCFENCFGRYLYIVLFNIYITKFVIKNKASIYSPIKNNYIKYNFIVIYIVYVYTIILCNIKRQIDATT